MTQLISMRSRLAAIMFAAASVATLAGAAQAEDQRIAVGDLSQPGQAQAFMHRLDAVARSMCDSYAFDATRAAKVAACKVAVREEALDQLPSAQRAQLIAHANGDMRLAARDH